MRLACVTRMTFLMAVAALLLHLVSGVVHPSRGQSSLKDDIASSSRGVPRPEAAIRVCTMPNTGQPCTPLAQIYSDSVLSQVLANPAATDGLGNYFGNVSSTGAINAFSFSLIGNLAADGSTAASGNLASGTLNLTKQGTPPSSPGPGTLDPSAKSSDKKLHNQDETGTETGPIGGTGGAGPSGRNGHRQSRNGTALQDSNGSDSRTVVKTKVDAQFAGPNPYIDVRAYGVRAVSVVPTTTCTTNGTTSISLPGGASTFINGDGIVCRGAGATERMSTPAAPAVAAVNAGISTGTGSFVANPSGAATYRYQIVAVDQGGGYTVASAATSIANGPATMGSNSVGISSWTRSNTTVTVTTAAAHNLVQFAGFCITGDASLIGCYSTATAKAGTTTFTFNSGQDTRNGAATSGGGAGTVTYFLANHITWPHVAGAYKYLIYGRTSGAMRLLGVSLPDITKVNQDPLYNNFDDFGATMTFAPASLPDWVPSTPPSAAKNDDLITVIVSGAGTTSIVVRNAAMQRVTAQVCKFDNAPNILSAIQAAVGVSQNVQNGFIYFPVIAHGQFYVTQSVLNASTFPAKLTLKVGGAIALGDTLIVGNTKIVGERNPVNAPQFSREANIQISGGSAHPMINSVMTVNVEDITFTHNPNGVIWVSDGGGIPANSWRNVNFSTSGPNDYMGRHVILRNGVLTGGPSNFLFQTVNFNPGGVSAGQSTTPLLVVTTGGAPFTLQDVFMSSRGLYFGSGSNTTQATLNTVYCQGCIMPKIVAENRAGGMVGLFLEIKNSVEDTTTWPIVAYGANQIGLIRIIGTNGLAGQPLVSGQGAVAIQYQSVGANPVNFGSNTGTFYGPILESAVDGVNFTSGGGSPIGQIQANTQLLVGPMNQVVVGAMPQAAPVAAVISGGTQSPGRVNFRVAPVFSTGGEGPLSFISNTVTFPGSCPGSGTCQASVTWNAVPGAIGYDVYHNGTSISCAAPMISGGATTSFTWNGLNCGQGAPKIPGTGPTALTRGSVNSNALKLSATNNGGVATVTAPALTANRAQSLPDSSGTFLLSPSLSNPAGYLPHHFPIANAAGQLVNGIPPMNVYDSFTRANGSLQSGNANWTVTTGGVKVINNVAVGASGSQNMAVYNGVSFPTDDQSARITVGQNGNVGGNIRVIVRGSATANTSYFIDYAGTSTTLSIAKFVAGTFTPLVTSSAFAALSTGDTLEINAQGTTLTAYVNGKQVAQATDASIASGFPGIGFFAAQATNTISDFSASYGGVSLNVAQTWSQLQTFSPGIAIGTETVSASPRGPFNVFFPGALTSTWTGESWTLDKAITVTRVQAQAKTAPAGCTTNAVIRLTDGTTPVNLTIAAAANDSGAITQNYAAGATLTVGVQTAAAGCGTSPADANAVIQFRMQ